MDFDDDRLAQSYASARAAAAARGARVAPAAQAVAVIRRTSSDEYWAAAAEPAGH